MMIFVSYHLTKLR